MNFVGRLVLHTILCGLTTTLVMAIYHGEFNEINVVQLIVLIVVIAVAVKKKVF